MAERYTPGDPTERHETVDPKNPPSSVVEPDIKDMRQSAVGVVAMWYYLGPLLLIAVVIGAAVIYWANNDEVDPDEAPAVGTIGERADDSTPGGDSPDRQPGSTSSELEFRGAGEPPQRPMPGLRDSTPVTSLGAAAGGDPSRMAGRRIDVQNVVVVDARDQSTFWIQDGDAKVAVVAPAQSPAVRAGTHVDVSGTLESDEQGVVRIRATRVDTRN